MDKEILFVGGPMNGVRNLKVSGSAFQRDRIRVPVNQRITRGIDIHEYIYFAFDIYRHSDTPPEEVMALLKAGYRPGKVFNVDNEVDARSLFREPRIAEEFFTLEMTTFQETGKEPIYTLILSPKPPRANNTNG